MNPFKIPPRINNGQFGFGDQELSWDKVSWSHLTDGLDNGEGLVTTSTGKGEISGRTVSFVIGYRAEDELPFLSYTVFAPAGLTSWCSFNFEEVQS